MNNANMLKPALIGGVALGILSAMPGLNICNCVCCAWVIGGGILTAYLYVKDSQIPVTMGRGAGAGLAAGAIGAIVCGLFSIPIQLFSLGGNQAMVMERFQEMMAKNPDFPEELRQSVETFLSNGDLVTAIAVLSFFGNLVFFSLFAMLGGAIGVAIFEKRKKGDFQQYINPPQPPAGMQPPQPPAGMQPPQPPADMQPPQPPADMQPPQPPEDIQPPDSF